MKIADRAAHGLLVLAIAGLAASGAVHATEYLPPDCSLPEETDFPLRGTARYWGSFSQDSDPPQYLDVLYSLGRQDSTLYGSYLYKEIGLPLRLRGCVDPEGRFTLEETDPEGAVTGRMIGQFEPPFDQFTDFRGVWTTTDGRRPFSFYGALTALNSNSGLDCRGNYGEMAREDDGDFEPLPAERVRSVARKNLIRFGPFDRAKYGFDGAVAGLRRSCETREGEMDGEAFRETHCETELIVGIVDGSETSWWVKNLARLWEEEGHLTLLPLPFRLTEAAAPSLPKLVLTEEIEGFHNYTSSTTTTHRLIELHGGEPRITRAQQCEAYQGVRDWNGSRAYWQRCNWIPEREDFLCREVSGYSPLWAVRVGFREFWLNTGEPDFTTKPGQSGFRTPLAFLEVLASAPEQLEERIVIDHIGEVTPIETFVLPGDQRLHLFCAPQRELEPGARFFTAVTGTDIASRWDEVPAVRFRFDGDDDRTCWRGGLSFFHVPIPEEDLYTQGESEYSFVAKPIETGDPEIQMRQVMTHENVWDDGGCRSVYWIVIDQRNPKPDVRALMLTTEGLHGGSGLDMAELRFPRVIEVGDVQSGRLGTLLVSPAASVDVKAPRDRIFDQRCPSPRWIELSWNGAKGFGIVVDEDKSAQTDRGYAEPEIGETGEIIPGPAPPPPLAEQILERLREDGIDAAVDRVNECYVEGSEDQQRFLIFDEIILVIEDLLSQGRVREAAAIMDPVRGMALGRFTQMLVDAGDPDQAAILVQRTVPAGNPGFGIVENACKILAEADRRVVAIEVAQAYVDKWRDKTDPKAIEKLERRIRNWKLKELATF